MLYSQFLPTRAAMFERIEEICSWGIRRPGYPAGRRAEDYCVEEFKSLGLKNVRREPVPVAYWEAEEYCLKITAGGETFEVDCFPLPHTALDVDIELPLALFEGGKEADVKGKAALVPLSLIEAPATMLAESHEGADRVELEVDAALRPSGRIVDAGGTLKGAMQLLPFTPYIQEVVEPVLAAGAAAFIGVLKGHPGDICEYYVPYDGVVRELPAVWMRESDGAAVEELLGKGEVSIALRVKARREMVETYNIIGDLPGPGSDTVMIGSHHDAPWASAVEDASGMALVLAQAEYWAQVPEAERPHNLRFILQAGHMVGGAGGDKYIEDHRHEIDDIVLEVHLEHTANEIRAGADGPELTGECVPRWFFTSRNPDLERAVIDALEAEDLDRCLILAPDVVGDRPTTDGGMYHLAGVPLVNFLTAPVYLFDPLDTVEMIHQESLEPITRATIRIVNSTAGVSASEMRAGVRA